MNDMVGVPLFYQLHDHPLVISLFVPNISGAPNLQIYYSMSFDSKHTHISHKMY